MSDRPKITLPVDEELRVRLEKKFREYEWRKVGRGEEWEHMHPELAHKLFEAYRDACYKSDVLRAVLDSEQPVDTQALSLKLAEKYGEGFSVERFCIACEVIASYCGCGDESNPVRGGTGLPEA